MGVDHAKFPLENEASCRAAVHLMLTCSQLIPIPELHNAFGRSDLEVDAGDYHWVLEFKFAVKRIQRTDSARKGWSR